MSDKDTESKYDESIKNLQNIMKTVKDSNLEEDSSEAYKITEDSTSDEIVDEIPLEEDIPKSTEAEQRTLDVYESEDIINSTSVIDEEDAEKLSHDMLEIKEKDHSFNIDNDSSQTFEDNILNNVDEVFDKNSAEDNPVEESDIDLDENLDIDSEIDIDDLDDIDLDSLDDSDIDLDDDIETNKSKMSSNKDSNDTKNDEEAEDENEVVEKLKSKSKSRLIPAIGIVVGLITLSFGIYMIYGRSARVIDSVASGESTGFAILLIFIGALCLIFSIMKLVSFKTPFDSLAQSIKNIDAVEEDEGDMDTVLSDYNNVSLDDDLDDSVYSIKSDLNDENGLTKSSFDSDLVTNHPEDEFKITVKTSKEDRD